MSDLTLNVLREAHRNIIEKPFEEFANKHGFSILAGDKLVLPKSMRKKVGDHLGIIYCGFAKDAYLISPKKAGLMPSLSMEM